MSSCETQAVSSAQQALNRYTSSCFMSLFVKGDGLVVGWGHFMRYLRGSHFGVRGPTLVLL